LIYGNTKQRPSLPLSLESSFTLLSLGANAWILPVGLKSSAMLIAPIIEDPCLLFGFWLKNIECYQVKFSNLPRAIPRFVTLYRFVFSGYLWRAEFSGLGQYVAVPNLVFSSSDFVRFCAF
jgi:hypothetical protein